MDALTALRRRERIIAVVRWVAVVFGFLQVSFYAPPLPMLEEAAAQAQPTAYGLVTALAVVGVLAEAAMRVVSTPSALVRAGLVILMADVVITVGFLYAYAFDPVSAQWALLVLLPLEGALRFGLAGALGVWAGVTPLYIVRDLFFTDRVFDPTSVGYRLGLVLLIALFVGFMARELDEQRRILQCLNEASRQFAGRLEAPQILRVLCREAVRCLDAAAAVAYVHDGTWFQSVASWPPDHLPVVLEADRREREDERLARMVMSGPTRLEADEHRPARLAVPLPESDGASHVLVVQPRRAVRFSQFHVDAAAALAESASLALATSRVLADEQRSNRRMRYLEALRTRFVATVAHDLRLPLTIFKGVSQMLRSHREAITAEQIDQMLASVERQANRLSRLADDLLDAARMEADRLQLHLDQTDMRAVVDATTVDVEEPVEVALEDEVTLVADAVRLERILWNLLSNAEKYGRPPFEVRAWREGDEALLSVRDHGTGLDEGQRARLFQDFASSDDAASVGLGLAIVWQLVSAHGGRITYEDAEPGARFVVRLPICGPEHVDGRQPPAQRVL